MRRAVATPARHEARLPPFHVASIDLEDWYEDVEEVWGSGRGVAQAAFLRQLTAILDILDETSTGCTFFVLGRTAERYPECVARIQERGHEVASHGYGHALVSNLSRHEFEADVVRAVEVVRAITGQAPVGYRAPYFSLRPDQRWVYDVLASHGFAYSSSVLPFQSWRAGSPRHALAPTDVHCSSGTTVREYPVSVSSLAGVRIPVAGGGFWRVLPSSAICWGVRRVEREARPFIFYLHPHEFDDKPLRSHRGLVRNIYVNVGRRSIPRKMREMLSRHRFGSFRDLRNSSIHTSTFPCGLGRGRRAECR